MKDAAYLAVIAGIAVAIAAGFIGVNRWLDANAVPVAVRASALGEPAPVYQVAAGEQVLVTLENDTDVLYVCMLPGAPKVELNPRPGQEQSARFALDDARRARALLRARGADGLGRTTAWATRWAAALPRRRSSRCE